MPHVARQVGQHRGDVDTVGHPPFDVGVREVMAKVIRSWLLASGGSSQSCVVPDAVEHLPDCGGGDGVAGRRDEEGVPGRPEMFGRLLLACGQDPDDLAGQGQPSAAVAFGGHDVEVPVAQVHVLAQQGTGFSGAKPAGVHQREERRRLPPPRGVGVEVCGGGEERLDLLSAQQIWVSGDEGGFPSVRQHVGVGVAVGLQPPAGVADVGHPGAVGARGGQLRADPAFDGVTVEGGPIVGCAVGVEALQIPDPGGAVEAHLLLELEVGVQFAGERAGEAVGAHDRAASGTSSTQASRRSESTLM